MKIYFLSYWFPYPPDNGSRIRVFNFIKALSTRHDVFLSTLLQDDSDPANQATLSKFCKVVSLHTPKPRQKSLKSCLGLLSQRPRSVVANFDPDIYNAVQEHIFEIKPDVIVVSTLDCAEYATCGKWSVPSVLIDHNCEFAVIQRKAKLTTSLPAKLRYEASWRKFARWEARIIEEFDKVIMPTKEDLQKMQQYAPAINNIYVIPNAADTDNFDPSKWSPDNDLLVYNGALSYGANFDAILYYTREIHPKLSALYPNMRLLITGRYDNVKELDLISDCPGIELTGYVKDIREILYKSLACLIPLRQGGGMRLKIPEAMAAGVPVVSTAMGAEGLEFVDGEHLLIANTPDDFVTAIQRLVDDKTLVNSLRENARKLVEQKYSWNINAEMFVKLVETMVDSPHGSAFNH